VLKTPNIIVENIESLIGNIILRHDRSVVNISSFTVIVLFCIFYIMIFVKFIFLYVFCCFLFTEQVVLLNVVLCYAYHIFVIYFQGYFFHLFLFLSIFVFEILF
jgi:hypothetical protein